MLRLSNGYQTIKELHLNEYIVSKPWLMKVFKFVNVIFIYIDYYLEVFLANSTILTIKLIENKESMI